jgi:DNA-nicking Smr family endonuclease|tara:strand:+ start:186 stop:422 length:237 start_codon:yes stop_codon:yes gene_type:complete
MKEIDVHGMLHSDAITYIEDVVLEESLKTNMFEVKVITGNSPRLQRRIVKEICKKHELMSEVPTYNMGTMLIYNGRLI